MNERRFVVEGAFVVSGPAVIQTRRAEILEEGWSSAFNVTFDELLEDEHIGQTAVGQYNVNLWRQFEAFRPVGAPTTAGVVVNMTFTDDPSAKYIIDNFQSQSAAAPNVATSGATVTIGVQSFVEGRCDDANADFANNVNDPFNGFTYDEAGAQRSEASACVFGYDGSGNFALTYDLATAPGRPSFRDYNYLSFRAGLFDQNTLLDRYAAVKNAFDAQVAFEGIWERREGYDVTTCSGCETAISVPLTGQTQFVPPPD